MATSPASGAIPGPGAIALWRERVQERLWRAAEVVTTPFTPADYLDLFNPLRPGADLRGRVIRITPETADAATLEIRPGADWRGHQPGQYVRIGVEVDGVRHWRAYSLTHGPRADGLISITVKAVAGGRVSTHLVRRAKVGSLVHLEQAAGDFVLPPDLRGRKLLFVTAGSGVTPVIGMLRNLFPVTDSGVVQHFGGRAESRPDVTVVHVAPSRPDSIFIRNLETLEEAGAIRLVTRYSAAEGRLTAAELDGLVPDLAERTAYACGPAGLLDDLQTLYDDKRLPLQTEQFRIGTVVTGEGGSVEVGGQTVEMAGDQTILDAAEDAGVLMPSGCRMGICFGCVLPMKSGAVRDLRNGELTVAVPGETGPEGVPIQTCISAAAGECVIDH